MTNDIPLNPTSVGLGLVLVCWMCFGLAFVIRQRPSKSVTRVRRPAAFGGLALQALGYGAVWSLRRLQFTPIVPMSTLLETLTSMVAFLAAATSVWMTITAIRTLGKQWAIAARVVEGHELVTSGPFRFVRHPIYTAMFGLLFATGLMVSHPYGLLAGAFLFWMGTLVRIRTEEGLLRETFGEAYDQYARRVPGIFGFD